jgi:hypothetical protein
MVALLFIFALGFLWGHSVRTMDFSKSVFLPVVFGLAAITAWKSPDLLADSLNDTYLWVGFKDLPEGDGKTGLWLWDGKNHLQVTQSPEGVLRTFKGPIPAGIRYEAYPDGPPDSDWGGSDGGRAWPYE